MHRIEKLSKLSFTKEIAIIKIRRYNNRDTIKLSVEKESRNTPIDRIAVVYIYGKISV